MSNNSTSKVWYKKRIFLIPAGLIVLWFIIPDSIKYSLGTLLGVILTLAFWGAIIFGIVWVVRKHLKNKKAEENASLTKKQALQREIFDEFKLLGENIEEREKEIKYIFDKREVSILFADHYDFNARSRNNQGNWFNYKGFVAFRIHRNLAAMEEREREFLRSAILLYNRGILNDSEYKYYLFAFINGNGKASIDHWQYSAYAEENLKDGGSCVSYYQSKIDGSVDQAINQLLPVMNSQPDLAKKIWRGDWLDEDEIQGTIYNSGGDYQLCLGHLDENETALYYSGGGSLITIAPPGSGKTQCFVYPNLLNWKSAAVVLDIKPEIYKATHKWREENVGKVFKFDPLNPGESHCYNPLTFVRDEPEYIWEDSGFLAEMMIVPSGASDPFWENMARDVLTSAIAHVTFNYEVNDRPLSKVLDIMYGIGWDEMITTLKTNVLVNSMRRMGTTLEDMDKKQRDSVLKTAQSSLSAWSGARMERITAKSDWNPAEIRKESQTVYICIKAGEVDKYISVLRVFLAQHIQLLLDEKELQHDREKIASPILFMLDEFPQLKRMLPIEKALNVGAGYGIRLWMFAQSYGQLKEAYPNAEGLVGSCAVRTFMNLPITDEYTAKVSEMLGKRHDALSNKEEPLVTPRDLAGSDYKDYILVLATGTKPAKVKKKFAYQDEEIKAKMN